MLSEVEHILNNGRLRGLAFVSMLLSFMLFGCGQGQVVEPSILINLSEHCIHFLRCRPGHPESKTFAIRANGARTIDIQSAKIIHSFPTAKEEVFSYQLPTLPTSLAKNEVTIFSIGCASPLEDLYEGQLQIKLVDWSIKGGRPFTLRIALKRPALTLPGLPLYRCDQSPETFGPLSPGKQRAISCTFHNQEDRPIQLVNVTLTSEQKNAFSIQLPFLPVTIPARGKLPFQLLFHPYKNASVQFNGTWQFVFNSAPHPRREQRILVSGQREVADVRAIGLYGECQSDKDCATYSSSWTCRSHPYDRRLRCLPPEEDTTLWLPYLPIGEQGDIRFVLMSSGSKTLHISRFGVNAEVKDMTFETSLYPRPLALSPDQSVPVKAWYQRKSKNTIKGELWVNTNAETRAFPVRMLPSGCVLKVSTRALHFSEAGKQTITLKNIGNRDCFFRDVGVVSRVKDDATYFSMEPPTLKGLVVGEEIPLEISFSRSTATLRRAEVLITFKDEPKESLSITLTGQSASKVCVLTSSSLEVSMGWLPVGKQRERSFTIQNRGSGDCVLERPVWSGNSEGFALVSPSGWPTTVASGSSISVRVAWSPKREQSSYKATLAWKAGAARLEQSFSGSSQAKCLLVIPGTLDFGEQEVGCGASVQTVHVYHTGASGCPDSIEIYDIAWVQKGGHPFKVTKQPLLPVTLQAREQLSVAVHFEAEKVGLFSNQLVFHSTTKGLVEQLAVKGKVVDGYEQIETFRQVSRDKLDMLFVIDTSSKMATYQKDVVAGLKKFVEWMGPWSYDTQVAVVKEHFSGKSEEFGCFSGSKKILSLTEPHFSKQFENNLRVGELGAQKSRVFDLMKHALSPAMLNNAKCNRGFLRKGARLRVYIISANRDASQYGIEHYLYFLGSLKKSHSLSAIKGNVAGPDSRDSQWTPFTDLRFFAFSNFLKGVYVPVGRERFWRSFTYYPVVPSFQPKRLFSLSGMPRTSTLSVFVNGQRVKKSAQDGWEYVPNNIVFSLSALPPYNSQIDVRYRLRTCGK